MSKADFEIMSEVENKLFGRREVEGLFRNMHGKISRDESKKKISQFLKIDHQSIFIIEISGSSGNSNAKVLFHVYESPDAALKYLPKYIIKRNEAVSKKTEDTETLSNKSINSSSASDNNEKDSKESNEKDSKESQV